jgi:hypothetical protein
MADTKISALPAATTLAGTDIIPVVQGGITKQAALNLYPAPGVDTYILFNKSGVLGTDPSLQYAYSTGSFLLSLSGNSNVGITVQNVNAGTSAQATYIAKNSSNQANYGITGTGLTPIGSILANEAYLYTDSPVGLLLMCNSTTGIIVLAPGGTAEKGRMSASGGLSIGSTLDPGAGYINALKGFMINGVVISASPTKVITYAAFGGYTYTPTVGIRALWVQCVGGGGGAGGVFTPSGAWCATAGGGGGGGCSYKYIASPAASYSITVGAGGAGGANTGGTGGTGGDSLFGATSVCTGKGGAGGVGSAGVNTFPNVTPGGNGGGVAGGMVGDVTVNGNPGGYGLALSASGGPGGAGGGSGCGGGGGAYSGIVALGAGSAGTQGGGGGGGMSSNGSGNSVGAAGGAGFIVIMEFF